MDFLPTQQYFCQHDLAPIVAPKSKKFAGAKFLDERRLAAKCEKRVYELRLLLLLLFSNNVLEYNC